jgi:hypothetical protein
MPIVKAQSQPRQKVRDPISKPSWAWWFTPVNPATQEAQVGESQSEAGHRKRSRPYLKNKLKAKGAEGIA